MSCSHAKQYLATHANSSSRSHIDITAVQALIDTRDEVERWADAPVEFHFASILSPWIRRALVAGGFGTGLPASSGPRELAPVLQWEPPFQPASGRSFDIEALPGKSDNDSPLDDTLQRGAYGRSSGGEEALLTTDTPFFHVDLTAAVRAAENGLKSSSSRSESVSIHRADGKQETQ